MRAIVLPYTLYDLLPYDGVAYLARMGVSMETAVEMVLATWDAFAVNDRERYYHLLAEWIYEQVTPSQACTIPEAVIREQFDEVVGLFLTIYQKLYVTLGQMPMEVLWESSGMDQVTFRAVTPSGKMVLNL
jgi:hypothetical protein